jgi:hypothetical protein
MGLVPLIHPQFRLTSVVPCLLVRLLLHMQVVLLHPPMIECDLLLYGSLLLIRHLLLMLVDHRLVSPNLLGVCGLSKGRLVSRSLLSDRLLMLPELLLVHLVLIRDLLLLVRDLLLVGGVVVSWPA